MVKKKSIVFYIAVFTIIALGVSFHNYLSGAKKIGQEEYTHYNNYLIFKDSYFHLKNNTNLYTHYDTQWDLYKYSPTFAFLMGGIAHFPNLLGLSMWNLINVLLLILGIWYLPGINYSNKIWVFAVVFIELITSIQNSQSNGLVAALTIFTLISLENNKVGWACFLVALSFYIKVFGIISCLLFLFYPNKLKGIIYGVVWMLVLLLIPLIIITPLELFSQYQNWFELLINDHETSVGISVAGLLDNFYAIDKKYILFAGMFMLFAPIIHFRFYKVLNFRLLFLANILIWMVIFNHKAESPTFIISVLGVSIWYFLKQRNAFDLSLLILVIVLTSISVTDLIPKFIKENYIREYNLKALPCVLVWLKICYELLFFQLNKYSRIENHHHQLSK